jgi:hypothetical protein
MRHDATHIFRRHRPTRGLDVALWPRCRERRARAQAHPHCSPGRSPHVETVPRGCRGLRRVHVHLVRARRSLASPSAKRSSRTGAWSKWPARPTANGTAPATRRAAPRPPGGHPLDTGAVQATLLGPNPGLTSRRGCPSAQGAGWGERTPVSPVRRGSRSPIDRRRPYKGSAASFPRCLANVTMRSSISTG